MLHNRVSIQKHHQKHSDRDRSNRSHNESRYCYPSKVCATKQDPEHNEARKPRHRGSPDVEVREHHHSQQCSRCDRIDQPRSRAFTQESSPHENAKHKEQRKGSRYWITTQKWNHLGERVRAPEKITSNKRAETKRQQSANRCGFTVARQRRKQPEDRERRRDRGNYDQKDESSRG